jgi:hypothetical protein
MRQAEQALHQQVQQVEYNAEAETAKGGDLEAARVAADPNLHLSRVAAEDSRLREAVESYHRFAFVHAHDLIAELTRGAEVRTEELARVRAAAHEPENAYHDVKGSIQTVVDLVRGPRPAGPLPGETENMFGFDAASAEMVAWSKWSLPLDESVPLPPAEVLAAHAALYAPEVTS